MEPWVETHGYLRWSLRDPARTGLLFKFDFINNTRWPHNPH